MEILSLAIVGGVVSALVQFIKSTAGLSGYKVVFVCAGISMLFGGAYYQFSQNTALWEAFVQILAYANLIYGVLIKRFE